MTQKIPLVIADLELQLATAISIDATSFSISSNEDDDGEELPAGKYIFTVDNGSSNKEYLVGTLSGTTVSSVKSVSRQGVETNGAARAHRVGASVILTDFAVLQRVADALRGAAALDGDSPLIYDTEPSLSDAKELATVGYVLSVVEGGTVYFSSQTIAGVAGEALDEGDIIYLKESDQRWWKTDADTAATVLNVRLGVAQITAAEGAAVTVLLSGAAANFSGLTAGDKYYASNTAGEVSDSAGTNEALLGVALSATTILFQPGYADAPTAAEKDAMAGGGTFGTPGASNKFITEDKLEAVARFGGTGADGALAISSGTTNIDLAGAAVVIKNYTSISITGTAQLTFTNPHANGTLIILKSQGNVVITTSGNPAIDLRNLGATGSSGAATTANSSAGSNAVSSIGVNAKGGGAASKNGSSTGGQTFASGATLKINGKTVPFSAGAGGSGGAGGGEITGNPATAPGGAGGGTLFTDGVAGSAGTSSSTSGSGGDGGRGAGALYIECGGALNISSVINAAGTIGSNGTTQGGGGGGGAGGTIIILYNTLTANTGTYTVSGGTGGTGAGTGGNGGDGAAGSSLVAANTEFV